MQIISITKGIGQKVSSEPDIFLLFGFKTAYKALIYIKQIAPHCIVDKLTLEWTRSKIICLKLISSLICRSLKWLQNDCWFSKLAHYTIKIARMRQWIKTYQFTHTFQNWKLVVVLVKPSNLNPQHVKC